MPRIRKKVIDVDPLDPWMTLGAAARVLKLSRFAVMTRIIKGELIGQHLGGQTFVRRDTVEIQANQQHARAS
jgi:hypothetical protein